jgi:hypothetical protein
MLPGFGKQSGMPIGHFQELDQRKQSTRRIVLVTGVLAACLPPAGKVRRHLVLTEPVVIDV